MSKMHNAISFAEHNERVADGKEKKASWGYYCDDCFYNKKNVELSVTNEGLICPRCKALWPWK